MDQTLGKPGTFFGGSERDKQKMTITARLGRVETQVSSNAILPGCLSRSKSLLKIDIFEDWIIVAYIQFQ